MARILESLKCLLMPPRKVHGFDEFLARVKDEKKLVILTTKHCLFIADLLVGSLKKLNIKTDVILKKPKWGYSDLPHIVICPQIFKYLPTNYIAFQMEQSESSNWFTEEYFKKLNLSVAVFDYSLANVRCLKKQLINPDKVFYLPLSVNKSYIDNFSSDILNRSYDVIFYGDDKSPRRQRILNVLQSKYNVKIINGVFGTELYKQLADAKIVINIHYYESALLETTRLYECLSLNNNVIISERGRDQEQHQFLEELVDFVDDGDIDGLLERVDYYLCDLNALNEKIMKNNNVLIEIKVTDFEQALRDILKM